MLQIANQHKQYLYDIYVTQKTNIINKFKHNNNMLRHEYAKIIPFDRLTLYYVEYDLESIKYLRETEWVLCRNNFLFSRINNFLFHFFLKHIVIIFDFVHV